MFTWAGKIINLNRNDYFKKYFEFCVLRHTHTHTHVFNALLSMCVRVHACSVTLSDAFNSLQPDGLHPTRLLCPWDFPDKNAGAGCHFLLQQFFPTQELSPCLQHGQVDSLPLSHLGSLISIFLEF